MEVGFACGSPRSKVVESGACHPELFKVNGCLKRVRHRLLTAVCILFLGWFFFNMVHAYS